MTQRIGLCIAIAWLVFTVIAFAYNRSGYAGIVLIIGLIVFVSCGWALARIGLRRAVSFISPVSVRLTLFSAVGCAWLLMISMAAAMLTMSDGISAVSLVSYGAIVQNTSLMFIVYAAIIMSYGAFGNFVQRRLQIELRSGFEGYIRTLIIGFCVSVIFFYGAALIGVLNWISFIVYLLAAALVGWKDARHLWRSRHGTLISFSFSDTDAALRSCFVATMGIVLVLSCIAQFGFHPLGSDDLRTYYLVPKTFVEQRHIVQFPHDLLNNGPVAFAYGYAPYLLFGDRYLTIINILAFILMLGAVYAIAQRWFGSRVGIAAIFFVSTVPLMYELLYTVKADLWMATILLGAVLLLFDERADYRQAFLAGVLMGLAFAVKYNALFFIIAAFMGVVLWHWYRNRSARHSLVYGMLLVGALVIGYAPWGLRMVWLTGNPIYPFLTGGSILQHQTPLDPAAEREFEMFNNAFLNYHESLNGAQPASINVWHLVTSAPSYGGNRLGPLFFGMIGFLALAFRRLQRSEKERLLLFAGISVFAGMIWFYVSVSQ
ncbi:MAG: glycosyltransferase family 39 protein, partial [Candidatus Komeilibacteria bacterium]|nr:glycosyltransferase family 39 protein [Candidatus Komeilibacteria bacterium]